MSHVSRFVKMIMFIFTVTSISLSLSYLALAVWDEPNNAPPVCNPAVDAGCNAPINVSGTAQTKSGALTVNNRLDAASFYDADNSAYFLNPSAGASAIMAGSVNIGGTFKSETAAGSWNWLEINRGGDKVFFGSDGANRGIWSEGTRDVGIATNGSNRLIVNGSSGNVGIGTAGAPGAKLEVAGQVKITGGTPGVSKVLTSDASGLASWQSLTGTLPGGISGQTLRHDGVGWVANSFLFNNGVNIGIDKVIPGEKLDVKGKVRLTSTADDNKYVNFDAFQGGVSETILDIDPMTSSNALSSQVRFFRDVNTTGNVAMYIFKGDGTATANHSLKGNGDSYLAANNGNVGIGTSAPGAKLEVAGQVKITGGTPGAGKVLTSDVSGLASWQALVGGLPGGASGQTLRHDGTTWIANSNLFNNGANVGIGTAAPGYKLDVNGSLNATNYVWKGGVNWSMPDANSEMSFDFATGDGTSYWQVWDPIRGSILAVRNNGNVGIGNSAPSYKLDLNGTLRVSGAGIYNSSGSQLVQTNATDWTRWNQGSGATNGNAMYQSLALGTGGLTVGAWENQATGVLKVTGSSYLATSSGNVGIGTTTPDAKLDISVGGTVQCCAAGQKPNLSLDQASNVNNQMAWLQFHNSGESEAYIRLAGGGAGSRAGARRLEIGDSQGVTTGLTVTGDVTGRAFFYSSDERLKENIQKIEDPLEKILNLNGVTFNWKNGGNESVGLTAQNVEKVFPELVNTDNAGMKSVEYGNLVAPLIEAMKEQQKMIENQQKEIDALKALIK